MAVSEVSAQAEPHMITAIIGANGAGKTTLFNAISGLQRVTEGHVWYRGKDLTKLGPADVSRLGVARTFQNLRVFNNMSVLDNVMVGRHRHEMSHFLAAGLRLPRQRREERESREYCLGLLSVLGIADKAEDMVGSLPYGQQRLVEIARALATEPTLLLLDEPAAGMNDMERGVLREKIATIKDLGIQILVVEHDMQLIMGISDYVVVLDHGGLICAGDPECVQCHPEVVEAYLGANHHDEKAPRTIHSERVAGRRSSVETGHLLEIQSLSTSYGSISALRDVSLHVDEGECMAILGANGAGKSTLLRTVCGSTRRSSGRVVFDGRDISRLATPQIVGLGVCQVLEGRHVFPTLSVYDNLLLGAGRRHRGKAFTDELDKVFELFPRLLERRQQTAGSLSGGEQQMLAIGRALMGRPRVLLLDEPSMGLAPLVVETIFEALRALNDAGLTLLMVEQNANAALTIADRAVVLVTGKIALTGKAAELKNDPRLNGLYLGRTEDCE
jgi:branched-chain amino acid transport system ATP-binding protein